jgi:hypothetical protein
VVSNCVPEVKNISIKTHSTMKYGDASMMWLNFLIFLLISNLNLLKPKGAPKYTLSVQ